MPWRPKENHNEERRKRLAILRKKEKGRKKDVAAVSQTGASRHPFTSLASYYPGKNADFELYRSLREAVPIIDAAILKTVRLLGSFEVRTGNEKADEMLRYFLRSVNVSGTRTGIDSFVSTFFEQLLTYGTAVGEIVVSGGEVSHLYNARLEDVSLSCGENPLAVTVSARDPSGLFVPVRYPELIVKCVHNPEPGSVYGTSVLKGLPFVSDVFLKIMNTVGVNWERLGNVRFAVTYKPQNDAIDKAYARERAQCVADEWSKAMDPNGPVKDFIAVGDVSIKAIGADNQILDSEVPVRQVLEQIVAKLGIPPFLLGLSWSATERMSYQQADILTSEIDAYRREIEPVIRKICLWQLRLSGFPCDVDIVWDDITLQDLTEISRSGYYNAQAEKIRNEIGGEKNEKQNH